MTKRNGPSGPEIISQAHDAIFAELERIGINRDGKSEMVVVAALRRVVEEYSRIYRPLMKEAEALFDGIYAADYATVERYVNEHPPSPGVIKLLVTIAVDRYRSDAARRKAMKRIAQREPAKRFIVDTWEKSGSSYKSKADFVRVMFPLLKENFPDTEVTPRTVETAWLGKR